MFQAAAKVLVCAPSLSAARGVLSNIRHYCRKTPATLRVSEALTGAELGANIKVQVQLLLSVDILF